MFGLTPSRGSWTYRALLGIACGVFGLSVPAIAQQTPQTASAVAHGVASLQPIPQADRVLNLAPGGVTRLSGHVPAWATPDKLTAESIDDLQTLHLTIVLQRSPAVQKAFEALLAAQQDPASAVYHQWLTPVQVGSLFGPTQHDVEAVTNWLTAQGLHVDVVAPSRMLLQVSGPVNSVSAALHVSFSKYRIGGKATLAPDAEPSLPQALAPVVRSIDGLSDLPPEPAAHSQLQIPAGGNARPQSVAPDINLSGNHYLTPNDFAVIYDLNSVYTAGNTGATIAGKAQHIAVIDRSDVASADITSWAANVGIANPLFNTILATGTDPGQAKNDDQLESTLDLIRTIGTAPGAVSDLVVAPNSTGGILAAAQYNVNTLMDPVMTISFYGCEATRTAANVASWDTIFSTGAMEGISTFVCSGDSGAAGCASDFSNPPATTPAKSVNYICSSTYATCVGGTEFADTTSPSTYWSAINGTGGLSALSYIPEGAWNEPTTTNTTSGYQVASTGGGASVFITKPTWQTGAGVPADGGRDQPDISFSSSGHDGYYGCLSYNGYPCTAGSLSGYYYYLFGTSAAAPSMAGIAALLNTRAGAAQGNLNPLLYKLAASAPAAFHDVTVASSGVSGCSTSIASMCNNSTPSSSALTGGLAGYAITAGYDQATGLGSLDGAYFLAAASPASTTLTLSPASSTVGLGQSATVTATVALGSSSVASPTGAVQFYANGTAFGSPVTLASNSAAISYPVSATAAVSITAKYSGDTYFMASTASAVSVAGAPPAFTESVANASLTFTSGATSGNSNTVTLSSAYGFAGAVALTCTITTSSAAFQPTCAVSPANPSLTSGGTATATVTITSTVAQAALGMPGFREEQTIALAALTCGALFLIPLMRRRNTLRGLLPLVVCAFLWTVTGCGGSSSSSNTGGTTTLRSSAGSYTVTVSASGTSSGTATSTQKTFTLTIN